MSKLIISLLLLGQVYRRVDGAGEHFTDDLASVPKGVTATTAEGAPISVIEGARAPSRPRPPPAKPGQRPPRAAPNDSEPNPTIILGPLPASLKAGDADIIEAAVQAARDSTRLKTFKGLRTSIAVDLIDRADDPRRLAVPEWAGAFAVSGRQVYLLSPYIGGLGGGRPRPWNQMTLHEVAHAQQQQWTRAAPVPRWFREGYAMLVSGEEAGASSSDIAWWAIRHGGTAPLTNTWNSVGEGPRVANHATRADHALFAYGVSLEGVKFITELSGEASIGELFEAMHEGADFQSAFKGAVGLDLRDFELRFLERVRPAYFDRGE